jgi:hypothetical protein
MVHCHSIAQWARSALESFVLAFLLYDLPSDQSCRNSDWSPELPPLISARSHRSRLHKSANIPTLSSVDENEDCPESLRMAPRRTSSLTNLRNPSDNISAHPLIPCDPPKTVPSVREVLLLESVSSSRHLKPRYF